MHTSREVAHISSRKYNRCLQPFSVFYVAILTPARRVGEEKISDRSGAKFWAIGTRTGENKGIDELASCKNERKFSQSWLNYKEDSYIGKFIFGCIHFILLPICKLIAGWIPCYWMPWEHFQIFELHILTLVK